MTLVGCASAPTTGFVSGRLQAVGGPAPGSPRPINGKVTVRGPNGRSYSAKTEADGQFLIQVPVGSYLVTARSPQYEGGQTMCLQTGTPIKVNENSTTGNVTVDCEEM
jgi:hypothetical protein